MTKKHPYAFGKYEIPRAGVFLDEDHPYPLVAAIEDQLYPANPGPGMAVIPNMTEIHAKIVARVRPEDMASEPEDLADESGAVIDEVWTLKPEAAERIAGEVRKHYGR